MTAFALLTLAIWVYLLFARGFFWWLREPRAAASPIRHPRESGGPESRASLDARFRGHDDENSEATFRPRVASCLRRFFTNPLRPLAGGEGASESERVRWVPNADTIEQRRDTSPSRSFATEQPVRSLSRSNPPGPTAKSGWPGCSFSPLRAERGKEEWPAIVAVVPARNEAPVIGEAIASLLAQDYPGEFRIVLVDDHSHDGTADIARKAAKGHEDRLTIVAARPLPPGWTGKLWALSEGVRQIEMPPDLYLFTDADIAHHATNLRELVARLAAERRDLVSLMVNLHCESFAERFLIPPFVFFFALLYPFRWSNDPGKRIAAAAGGCILMRREAYERIGGYASLRGALIDDCALAREVKRGGGSIWLGLSQGTKSLRPYPKIADIWNMVARTAYTQLHHSPFILAGTVLGMVMTYLAPPLLLVAGESAAWRGGLAWLLMVVAYLPILRFYRLNLLWAPLLPLAALVYLGATIDSAWRDWRGRGGEWKGRVQWQSRS